jgi:chromosome segregation protein
MRLAKLKLAGFKSFVDPTTVHFPGNLTGVVGPNGCGKSNIIDAVRWVMGEISAKHLRGSEMADVIFNGSGARKPIGAASVELVFDNGDGLIGGPYAAYSEVSLRRVVSRDGISTYYINGARCRRKDITQLFLGTGLGSRSYAIIEQGTISRLIEAKPDDLRAFLEEAAGISRYKERRHDTENRIAHTRENLERLNDLREELDKQMRHLQRQAATARRYQAYKEEERRLHAELLALRIRDLLAEAAARDGAARERDTELQAALAALRSSEAAVERSRERHAAASERLNDVQGRYYQRGADVARVEQAIQHARELRARQRGDLEQARRELGEAKALLERDRAEIEEHRTELAALEPALAQLRDSEAAASTAQDAAEQDMQAWQQSWEEFTAAVSAATQAPMVERARIEQLEARLSRAAAAGERLQAELGRIAAESGAQEIEQLARRAADAMGATRAAEDELKALLEMLQKARDWEGALQTEADEARAAAQQAAGQRVSTEALQQAALGATNRQVSAWLSHNSLGDAPRLAQQLSVDPGWERAVETVLGSYLEAVCVPGLDAVAALLGGLNFGQLSFIAAGAPSGARPPAGTLLAKVRGPQALGSLLGRVQAVDRLEHALARRAALAENESIITRDGIWIGRDWLRVSRDQDPHAGMIEREHDLKALRAAQAAAERAAADCDERLARGREALKDLERRRHLAQERVNEQHRTDLEAHARRDAARSRASHAAVRAEQLEHEAQDLANETAAANSELAASRERLQAALVSTRSLEQRRPGLEAERERARDALATSRSRAETERDTAHEFALRTESRRAALASLGGNLTRLETQLSSLAARRAELERELTDGEAPLAAQAAELDRLLAGRSDVERELAAARSAVEAAESEFRGLDETRQSAGMNVDTTRQAVAAAALAAQETRVRRESLLEQFATTKFELEAVTTALPGEAQATIWEQSVAECAERIERLGQVNLAAIDEFREVSERKEYLDRQFNDLMEALNTLEQAIRKIDKETKSRFQDTFDRVNAGLKEKFPRLFGGGHAYLELTGEDLLAAGVTVMARPPGKRNVTISQLSGGEKALAAVALVFAIFELNPAPFCLLDEVDAPLDDHNVGRFCEIVREMSSRVQFLFITHNKSTMELAAQLIGVTMTEPGVSRLVTVDVDEALRLAAG